MKLEKIVRLNLNQLLGKEIKKKMKVEVNIEY